MAIEGLKRESKLLFYINDQTEEMCKIATENNWNSIKYVKDVRIKRKLEYEYYKNDPDIVLGSEYNGKIFYKVINKNMTNFMFTYKLGLNELIENFNPRGDCTAGGFYFCELQHLKNWLFLHPDGYVCEVRLPLDALVFPQNLKYKTEKIIIENPIDIIEFIKLHKMEEEILKFNSAHVKDVVINLLKTNGLLLKHIKHQTLELCIQAIKQNNTALSYVNLEFYYECLKVI